MPTFIIVAQLGGWDGTATFEEIFGPFASLAETKDFIEREVKATFTFPKLVTFDIMQSPNLPTDKRFEVIHV